MEKRALEVWETPEKLEEERELREQKREKTKINKFNKQVKSTITLFQYSNHDYLQICSYFPQPCEWQCAAASTRSRRPAISTNTEPRITTRNETSTFAPAILAVTSKNTRKCKANLPSTHLCYLFQRRHQYKMFALQSHLFDFDISVFKDTKISHTQMQVRRY